MRYFRSFESYETLGTRRVPSRPTQLKKFLLHATHPTWCRRGSPRMWFKAGKVWMVHYQACRSPTSIAYFTLWDITFRCKLKTHISSAVGESTYTLSSLVSIQFLDSNRSNVSSSGQIIQYQNLNSYELGFQPACLRQMSATTKFPAIM